MARFLEWQIVAKYVTTELAYVVQIERAEAKIGAREDLTPLAVRATMIFRPGKTVSGRLCIGTLTP